MERNKQCKRKCVVGASLIFLVVLFVFFFTNHYYVPAKLLVQTEGPPGAVATVSWDSGNGFNSREQTTFKAYQAKPLDWKAHRIEIVRTGEADRSAQGSEVWLDKILIDGKREIALQSLEKANLATINDNQKLAIQAVGGKVVIDDVFQTMELNFYAHKWAGKVQIIIDGQATEMNLYSEATKSLPFAVESAVQGELVGTEISLPQTKIRKLQIKMSNGMAQVAAAKILTEAGAQDLLLAQQPDGGYEGTISNQSRSRFHPLLLAAQVTAAAAAAWLSYEAGLYWLLQPGATLREKAAVLRRRQRRRTVFWQLLASSMLIFSLWLIGQWPAIMTVDSYHFTWREIKTFQFLNVTPWVYNFYVLALTQFYDSPAAVTTFQVAIMAILGSTISHFAYLNGVNKRIVWLFHGLFIFSIPVAAYTVTMWKDIPFCLAMLFWGWTIFKLYFEKKYMKRQREISFRQLFLLVLSLLVLCTVRHNGLIFLAFVPLVLWQFKLMEKKKLKQFIVLLYCGYVGVFLLTPHIAKVDTKAVQEFFSATYRVGPVAAIYSANQYYSPDPKRDETVVEKWMTKEELKKTYTPMTQADSVGVMVEKWQKLSAEDRAYMNYLYFARSLQNVPLVLADRTAMFFGTMGFSGNVFIYANELNNPNDKSEWRPIESYRLAPAGLLPWLSTAEQWVIRAAKSFRGELPISPLVFNTLPAFLLLLGIASQYDRYPATALYASVFLFNIPFIFVILSTCEWRYLYFLLLASYFAIPLLLAEKVAKRKLSGDQKE